MYYGVRRTFGQARPLFCVFIHEIVKLLQMCLCECVHCEEETFGWNEIVLEDPEFVFWPDEGGINVCKSFFECISHEGESFL